VKTSRIKVERRDDELRVTIPARRHPLSILTLLIWAVVVGSFVFLGVTQSPDRPNPPPIAVTCMAALPGCVSLLWALAGREVITLADGKLVRRLHAGPVGFTRAYTLTEACNFRLADLPPRQPQFVRAGFLPFGPAGGSVYFDYGKRQEKLGAGLSEAEVPELIALLAPLVKRR
jgi:hypothetical protein